MNITFQKFVQQDRINGPRDLKPATWYRAKSHGKHVLLYRNAEWCITIIGCHGGDQITSFYRSTTEEFSNAFITEIQPLAKGDSFTVTV